MYPHNIYRLLHLVILSMDFHLLLLFFSLGFHLLIKYDFHLHLVRVLSMSYFLLLHIFVFLHFLPRILFLLFLLLPLHPYYPVNIPPHSLLYANAFHLYNPLFHNFPHFYTFLIMFVFLLVLFLHLFLYHYSRFYWI